MSLRILKLSADQQSCDILREFLRRLREFDITYIVLALQMPFTGTQCTSLMHQHGENSSKTLPQNEQISCKFLSLHNDFFCEPSIATLFKLAASYKVTYLLYQVTKFKSITE